MAADAIVVGSGPNGLAAAITLAKAGLTTVVREAQDTLGGGLRSAELTMPGFMHDVCSAVHPLAVSSPSSHAAALRLRSDVDPPSAPLAHPLDDGTAVMLERSLEATAAGMPTGGGDWARMHGPFVRQWDQLAPDVLGPPLRPPHSPFLMARFALQGLRPAASLANRLHGTGARALFAGNAAHSFLPLEWAGTGAFGLMLSIRGHASGWPIARGGSQRLADALAAYFRSLGGDDRDGSAGRASG